MAEVWRARDHLGRVVILSPTGLDHIQVRHDELSGRMGEIRAAVEHPDFVTRDRQRDHRECFYCRTPSGPEFIEVVIYYRPVPPQGTWEGEIITAYHVDEPEPKEAALWP